MAFHIVYNSFEPRGRDYIGKRSTDNPYDDYLGSFSDPTFQPEHKIALAYATSPEGAIWLEMMFQRVFNVVEDSQFANRSVQTSTKFQYDPTGLVRSPETRAKIAEGLRGKPKSEEAKKKMRKPKSPSHGANVSKSRQGMKLSPQHCEAIRAGNTGKKRTPEQRKRISEALTGVNTWVAGTKWFHNNNGETRRFSEPPGPEWKPGRKP
jgi:hypothetical protein